MLLQAGADVNARNRKRGITPVMIAGATGHFEQLKMLLQHPTVIVDVQVSVYNYVHVRNVRTWYMYIHTYM